MFVGTANVLSQVAKVVLHVGGVHKAQWSVSVTKRTYNCNRHVSEKMYVGTANVLLSRDCSSCRWRT